MTDKRPSPDELAARAEALADAKNREKESRRKVLDQLTKQARLACTTNKRWDYGI